MEHARRPNGRLYWVALAVAVVLAVGGGALAYVAYRHNASPAGVVGAYFDDLKRGDAAAALALGDVPHGSHALLTGSVLEQQQHIAPISDVSVGVATAVSRDRRGDHVTVPVTFALSFGTGPRSASTVVGLHRGADGWRMDRTAVPTQLMVAQAQDRATVLGARVPAGTVLLFPGVAPVTFDTPYLQLTAGSAEIDFQTGPTVEITTAVDAAGQARATSLVRAALQRCLRGHGSPGCPLPDERYVPGSVRGTLAGDPQLTVAMGSGADGTIEVTGQVGVMATYRRLDFHNRTVHGEGAVQLAVHAWSYATKPMRFVWEQA